MKTKKEKVELTLNKVALSNLKATKGGTAGTNTRICGVSGSTPGATCSC